MAKKAKHNRIAPELEAQWDRYLAQWDHCTRCDLHKKRQRVVHKDGPLPTAILFIGEAPGEQEDVMGVPFIGRAGKLLREVILPHIWDRIGAKPHYTIANVVGCAPWRHDNEGQLSISPPTKEEIETCHPRISTLIHFAAPKAVVLMGKTAANALKGRVLGRVHGKNRMDYIPVCHIYHPSYLLRTGGRSSPQLQKTILTTAQYLQNQLGLTSR